MPTFSRWAFRNSSTNSAHVDVGPPIMYIWLNSSGTERVSLRRIVSDRPPERDAEIWASLPFDSLPRAIVLRERADEADARQDRGVGSHFILLLAEEARGLALALEERDRLQREKIRARDSLLFLVEAADRAATGWPSNDSYQDLLIALGIGKEALATTFTQGEVLLDRALDNEHLEHQP